MASGGQQWGGGGNNGGKGGQEGWRGEKNVESVWGANSFGVTDKNSSNNTSSANMTSGCNNTGSNSNTMDRREQGSSGTSDRSSGSWQEALLKSVKK